MSQPFISICIPAYKRRDFLKRLLDSVAIQGFRDFEVIVTDDSPDEGIAQLCTQYADKFKLHYHKNEISLGTPENWNEAIRLARGQWIKLMHDDDWFVDSGSLSAYQQAIMANPGASFFFSAYHNVYLEKNLREQVRISASRYRKLGKNPATLFSSNVIGPPSVVIHRNNKGQFYDKHLKWLVDIEFYIRYLENNKPCYIKMPLINIGIGKEQVTQDCFRQRQVEIPEGFYLLNKTGIKTLKSILVYDAWWRMIRNLEIRKKEDLRESGYAGKISPAILSMIRWQRRIPLSILKIGPVSKSLMTLNYFFNRNRVKK